ncbi:MAG: 23S rRNA (adenine(1618)-N(6))-methyltransferase RlmF [Saprospiraceae bacterium]|nr:23S rRNA (adenine(1618)-N(6))-methyltransferase RlmF [Saprospiraceae bacterium]
MIKDSLHLRNRNRTQYDLVVLSKAVPALKRFVHKGKRGQNTIDFSDPAAVRLLNTALLKHHYGLEYWEFPKANLCPPIPGRAEYIHHAADLLAESNQGVIPRGNQITCIDIGTGASCIYPIIGVVEYAWNFIGTDIEPNSIIASQKIIDSNPILQNKITLRSQRNANQVFKGVVNPGEKIDIAICNPPFHASKEVMLKGNQRKVRNLSGSRESGTHHNFAGNYNELIYKGGEFQFIKNMLTESLKYSNSIFWFTCLLSKESNLQKLSRLIQKNNPTFTKTIEIQTGHKKSRILAWTYLSKNEQEIWRNDRWSVNSSY